MIFNEDSVNLILRGEKTQTRRPKRPGEWWTGSLGQIVWVCDGNNRLKWEVGRTYAIQPGRGKKAVGRFRLTGIRCERVADVSDVDAALEGIAYRRGSLTYGSTKLEGKTASEAYLNLWQRIYPKSDLTEMAWILEFEVEA